MNSAFIKTLSLGGIALGVLVFALKWLAYRLTGSVAFYSDALESIVNIATAIATYLAVRVSTAPPDERHPFGHQKAEYLSALLEGVLIIVAALLILREACWGFFDPTPLEAPVAGLAINLFAGLLNAGWCFALLHYGRRWGSRALVADGIHLRADVVTSIGVIVGVALAALTGWLVLDPLLAALVACYILWSGWKLLRQSIGGLMDEAASDESLARIHESISQEAGEAREVHDLRTRRAGRLTFIDFHLVVDEEMQVGKAHEICDRLEHSIQAKITGAVVTIHVEPVGESSGAADAIILGDSSRPHG